ncbi:MAG: hypothetical protein JNL44_13490 [Gemmatimonadetes bacterium]|nr:hypothetical protein [Gemmatimonadota bacterium]
MNDHVGTRAIACVASACALLVIGSARLGATPPALVPQSSDTSRKVIKVDETPRPARDERPGSAKAREAELRKPKLAEDARPVTVGRETMRAPGARETFAAPRDERPTAPARNERPTGRAVDERVRPVTSDPELPGAVTDGGKAQAVETRRDPERAQTLNGQLLDGKVRLRGPVRQQPGGRFVLVEATTRRTLEFEVILPLPEQRLTTASATVTALASRRVFPTGPVEGLVIRDENRILYVYERILDLPAFTTSERQGVVVRAVENDRRGLATRGEGFAVYHVPVEFSHGGRAVTLMPGQSGSLVVDGVSYRVSLLVSRLAVQTDNRIPMEEPRIHLEYTIAPPGGR